MSIKFTIPVRVTNPLNGSQGLTRKGMIIRAKRRKELRDTAKLCTMAGRGEDPAANAQWTIDLLCGEQRTITLTRVAPRPFDSDNLEASCKGVRDGIAEALGVSDGPSGPVVWKYAQRRGAVREYSVEVEIA